MINAAVRQQQDAFASSLSCPDRSNRACKPGCRSSWRAWKRISSRAGGRGQVVLGGGRGIGIAVQMSGSTPLAAAAADCLQD
jgi:hypothetical protein